MGPNTEQKEQVALNQLKERIPDLLEKFNFYRRSDVWLLRWLRAREMDVQKAEDMLRKHMDWRVDDNIDGIMEWQIPEIIDIEFPVQASGFDKDGCIVATVPFGSWDVRKLVTMGLRKEFVRYVNQVFEQAMRFLEHKSTEDRILTQFVIIFDFEGFSIRQLASKQMIETVAELLRLFEANHPETLKQACVVNAPKIFEILFAVIKPLLTARTLSKVDVFGCNTTQWRKALLANIDPDQLPSHYGGSISSPHNYKARYGYDVFPKYEEFPEEEFVCVTVEAGLTHTVEFSLSKDSCLSWNFRTVDYDIGFYMTVKDEKEEEERKMFECSRADSHLFLQKGGVTATSTGTYTLVFDNSYSKFRNKNVFYAARITPNAKTLRIMRVA